MISKARLSAFIAPLALVATMVTAHAQGTPADSDGQQRWLTIVNRSNVPIYRVHMTDVDTRTWGPDVLGRRIVDPGEATRVYPQRVQSDRGYCRFDVLIVFENNARYEQRQVNICRATTVVCSSTRSCRIQ